MFKKFLGTILAISALACGGEDVEELEEPLPIITMSFWYWKYSPTPMPPTAVFEWVPVGYIRPGNLVCVEPTKPNVFWTAPFGLTSEPVEITLRSGATFDCQLQTESGRGVDVVSNTVRIQTP